jgi:hypothetical protein
MCLNETYNKICVGKYLFDTIPIQNGLKQGDALVPYHKYHKREQGATGMSTQDRTRIQGQLLNY